MGSHREAAGQVRGAEKQDHEYLLELLSETVNIAAGRRTTGAPDIVRGYLQDVCVCENNCTCITDSMYPVRQCA